MPLQGLVPRAPTGNGDAARTVVGGTSLERHNTSNAPEISRDNARLHVQLLVHRQASGPIPGPACPAWRCLQMKGLLPSIADFFRF
jgi:hypothetical protein